MGGLRVRRYACTFVVLCAMLSFLSATAHAKSVTKVYLKAVKCTCSERRTHGNVHIVYSRGRDVALTTNGLARDPLVAGDGQTVGWLTGEHCDVDRGKHYVAHDLTIRRGSQFVRHWKTDYPAWGWKFVDSGKVALALGGIKRGVQEYQLRDIDSWRLLSSCQNPDYVIGAPPRPDWARGLPK